MTNNDFSPNKQSDQRTRNGFVVKVRFKRCDNFFSVLCALCVFNYWCVWYVQCNRPPRFLIDGQTEIVLRLKEGEETPVGEY